MLAFDNLGETRDAHGVQQLVEPTFSLKLDDKEYRVPDDSDYGHKLCNLIRVRF